MAVCPNRGRHLRFFDWRPEYPECGVNLNYFNANERLLADSEKAEREHARFQPRIDRGKAAYAGSKLAILRIVFTLLPVGALFLPLCKKFVDGKTQGVNVIDVYKFVSSHDIGAILAAGAFGVSVAALALSAVMILVCLISIIASIGRHGKGRTVALYSVSACAAVIAFICFWISSPKIGALFPEANKIIAEIGIGGILYVLLQIFIWAWNLFLINKEIPVKYTPCVIGGLPSEEYFADVERSASQSQIRRKMLVALTKMQVDAMKKEEKITDDDRMTGEAGV
ncbi:MAG: hypothetical protein IJL26_02595 [Clostridia bacterium]|nr:hypothetical protein [Clostridia bacterium]